MAVWAGTYYIIISRICPDNTTGSLARFLLDRCVKSPLRGDDIPVSKFVAEYKKFALHHDIPVEPVRASDMHELGTYCRVDNDF